MTELANNVLHVLKEMRSPKKQLFSEMDLITNGFSESESQIAIKELEEQGLIEVNYSYVNHSFELL